MSDLFNQITEDQDPLKKLVSLIPGFKGYIELSNRKEADKLLRETVASRFEQLWQRVSALQRDMLNEGYLAYMDDLESAAIKLRTFADRIRTASYGYSSVFEAVQIKGEELAKIYEYDLALLQQVDEVDRAIGNVEASIGSDGLPAAVRNLVSLSRSVIEVFDNRERVILNI